MYEYCIAALLGIIEGLTEFLPVSSTAHLIILSDILNFNSGSSGHVFEVFIQIGAILAVVFAYRKKIFDTVIGLPTQKPAQKFAFNIILGTIPALIAGAVMHDFIKEKLYNSTVIGVSLIVGGIIILLLEKKLRRTTIDTVDDISPLTALLIGCSQAIAIVPGVSRSGATIMGALSCGVARPAAAEFSFFLAIPVMFAAVAYDTYKNLDAILNNNQFGLMICGMAFAFVTALIVMKTAIRFINKYGFTPFAIYRIIVGMVILSYLSM